MIEKLVVLVAGVVATPHFSDPRGPLNRATLDWFRDDCWYRQHHTPSSVILTEYPERMRLLDSIPGGVVLKESPPQYFHYVSRTGPLDTVIFGIDIQSGDIRGNSPSYALVVFDGENLDREVVSRRKLFRQISEMEPDLIATDNMYELAEDKDALVHLLRSLPDGTRLIQVTGNERPEPLSRVASRHGVPYGKAPMEEAEAAAFLAARNVGYEVSAFTDTTQVKVSRGRSTGKGGWSEDRYTRRIHGSVRRRAREVEAKLEDAGLSYEKDVTEKYGGYANAVYRVDGQPGNLPVTQGRSGDVRIEIDRERKEGIEFSPLAKRRDQVLVGIDPGTTTGVAILDLEGSPLDVLSTRTADMSDIIEWIVDRGRPVIVAADVTPMPETVEKIRRSFDAGSWTPNQDLPIDEKLHRTRDFGYENDHERDALAAALFAFDGHSDQFDRIRQKVPPTISTDTVISRVVSNGESVEGVLADLEPDDEPEEESTVHRARELTPEEKRIKTLEERIDRLQTHIETLEETVAEKDEQIREYEEALSAARREDRRDARERRDVTRLQRATQRLNHELETQQEQTEALEGKLERLKELWKLDHSNFADVSEKKQGLVSIKPITQFTIDAIEAADAEYGLAKGDVILLRDASGAGRRTAEQLADIEPRIVLIRHGGLSKVADDVLFAHEIPVGSADDVAIQEVDELAVTRERDIESVIAAWEDRLVERKRAENSQMVDRLISEHRAGREEWREI